MVLLSELCQLYLLHFDEAVGLIPLLIFPDKNIKNNEKELRLIKYHPIWFLDLGNERGFEYIILNYNGKVYFAKKLKIFSKRKIRRVRFKDENFEIIVVIVVLPKRFENYGSALLNIITKSIKKSFGASLYQIIESEILKENVIKTPKIIEIIKRGDFIKENIKNLIKGIWEHYFDSKRYNYEKHQSPVLF